MGGVYPEWYGGVYASLHTQGGIPGYVHLPTYHTLGTPCIYTAVGVLPGTLSPAGRVCGEEALGSRLRIVRRMRRREARFLLKYVIW